MELPGVGKSSENEKRFIEDDDPPRSEPAPGVQEWLKQVIASDPGADAAWKRIIVLGLMVYALWLFCM